MDILSSARYVTSKIHVPGRFVLSDLLTRYFAPRNTLVWGTVGKYKVRLNLQDAIQRNIFFGIYDETETRLLRKLLKPGDNFIDIGANVGYYSLIASQLVGTLGQVHAFEPVEENICVLWEAIRINGITNIRPNQLALGDRDGPLELYMPEKVTNSGWVSIVPSEKRKRIISAQVVSLDDYVLTNHIDRVHLVKLDVEGAEHQVLVGGKKLFSSIRAPDLIIEVNPFLLERQNLNSQALTDPLWEWGYELYIISQNFKTIDFKTKVDTLVNLFCTKKIRESVL